MNWIQKLTQDHLKTILIDVQEKGENLEISDANDMINELKRQIVSSLIKTSWEMEGYEETL